MVAMKSTLKKLSKKYKHKPRLRIKERHTTGFIGLDNLIGGWEEGTLVQIQGKAYTGKSLIALQAISEFNTRGNVCLYIGANNFLNEYNTSLFKFNPDLLYVCYPGNLEICFEIMKKVLANTTKSLIVIDSLPCLTSITKREFNTNIVFKEMLEVRKLLKSNTVIVTNTTYFNLVKNKYTPTFGQVFNYIFDVVLISKQVDLHKKKVDIELVRGCS